MFNAFPLPQRESGAREALRYASDLAAEGYCILIFPEGKRTDVGEVMAFQPGVGMLASKLKIPVVPLRIEGLERVLHKSAKFPTPGRASSEIRSRPPARRQRLRGVGEANRKRRSRHFPAAAPDGEPNRICCTR